MKNENQNEKLKLWQDEIEQCKMFIAQLRKSRGTIPKRPSRKLVLKYAKHTFSLKKSYELFIYEWLSVFLALNKVIHFYESNLKETIGTKLNKFICPISYKNKKILNDQNFYFDTDSFASIAID